jgi:hypothetical protein
MITKIKKYKLFFSTFLFLFFLFFIFTQAQGLEIKYPNIGILSLSEKPLLSEYVRYLYYFSIIISGLIAFASLVYGGFRYLISVGNPVVMADARAQIAAGVIGLIIILSSYLLLTTINPQLTVFNLSKEVAEIHGKCGNNICEKDETLDSCPEDCRIGGPGLIISAALEIPFGALIEKYVLEQARLNEIKEITEKTRSLSYEVKTKSEALVNELNKCSCGNTQPNPSTCTPGQPCPSISCQDDPCDRDKIKEKKKELASAIKDLEDWIKGGKPYLSEFKKEVAKLDRAISLFDEAIFPMNYDNFLEIKQTLITAGGQVKVFPFYAYGQVVQGGQDPANFYIDIEDLPEDALIPPDFGPPALADCKGCEILLHDTSIVVTGLGGNEAAKDYYSNMIPLAKIKETCTGDLGSSACWDYVINWAKDPSHNWNPVFMLSLWGEESGFSWKGAALGCVGSTGELVAKYGSDIVGQLKCFQNEIAINCGGECKSGNTDFCAFMKCYSGGAPGCTLSNNPSFFPSLYKFYTQMVAPDTPGYPEGNCVLFQPVGPGLACPLWPGTFNITCNKNCYFGHTGIDLGKCGQGYWGQPIYAVDNGTVTPTNDARCGTGVSLATNNGIFIYCHFLSRSDIVTPGATVEKGELLGFTDSTGYVEPNCDSDPPCCPPGCIGGSHLHFGFWTSDGVQDPATLGIPCITIANTCH